ncbi:MAG: efflux RND transporter periplasmic adaptor subunit [Planctomycetota bacterium]
MSIARRLSLLTRAPAMMGGALLVGCGQGPPPGPPQGGPIDVTVATPLVTQTLDWDRYTGRLAAIEEVEVRARVDGYLVSYHFEEGQLVEQGDLLFVIDERPYRATLDQALAAREEATANQSRADAGIREAMAKKQQVIARQELASAQVRRARPLVPRGAISQDEFDVLVSESRQAEADGFAADAEIESARANLAAATAAIATADAQIAAAELDIQYCRVKSPISGRISRREVTTGNLVSGSLGATLLTTIVSLDPIHAYFDANEQALMKYIRLDRADQRRNSRDSKTPVYMALIDEEGYPHQGYIDFVDNRVDRSTGSIRARAIFPNTDEVLTPGMFIEAMIPGSAPYDAVLVPDAAISNDQATKIVYVVTDDAKIEVKRVTTGTLSKGLRVIRSGLEGTERVVIGGIQRCRPGAPANAADGVIEPGPDDGLPDSYEPVPPEQWLRQPPPPSPVSQSPASQSPVYQRPPPATPAWAAEGAAS